MNPILPQTPGEVWGQSFAPNVPLDRTAGLARAAKIIANCHELGITNIIRWPWATGGAPYYGVRWLQHREPLWMAYAAEEFQLYRSAGIRPGLTLRSGSIDPWPDGTWRIKPAQTLYAMLENVFEELHLVFKLFGDDLNYYWDSPESFCLNPDFATRFRADWPVERVILENGPSDTNDFTVYRDALRTKNPLFQHVRHEFVSTHDKIQATPDADLPALIADYAARRKDDILGVMVSFRIPKVVDAVKRIQAQEPQPTTTTLTSTKNPSACGESIALMARVESSAGVPTGSVRFQEQDSTTVALVNGVAVLDFTHLGVGTHTITATYQPEA